jgi:predicted CXXCH cytochrome family protein
MARQRMQLANNGQRYRRRRGRFLAAGSSGVCFLIGLTLAAAPKGEDVHRAEVNCRICHTADKAALNSDPTRAKSLLLPNLETTCNRCHGAEGPSHKTGMKAAMNVPADLPLGGAGIVTCATCHFMHGESNRFGDFLRIDNRRGKLCLSCHKISELK